MHVFIKCSYTHSSIHTVIWFSPKQKNKWKKENYPEDLALDFDFAGRVSHTETLNSSTLTIRDVRLRDSGEYRFMLVAANGEKYLSSSAVNLTVTDLQVKVHPGIMEQPLTLTCSTHCRLTTNWITWWKNGIRVNALQNSEPLNLAGAGEGGSYSCSVKTKVNNIYSPAYCVSEKDCWTVTYAQRRVCALKGSSVNFHCTYLYPSGQKVNESYWTFNQKAVRRLEEFAGRVEFVGDKVNNCTLRLTDLKESDSGDYRFHFTTSTPHRAFSSSLWVQLIVTDVQVRVNSTKVSDGQTIILSCITSCTLPHHMFSWYQNGKYIMNKPTKCNNLYLDEPSYNDRDEYTCAARVIEAKSITAGSERDWWWIQHAIYAAVGFLSISILILLIHLIRRAKRSKNDTDTQCITNPVVDIYTSLDPKTMSPTYDVLSNFQAVEVSLTDTYTSLSPVNRSSDYCTLFAYSRMMRHQQMHPAHVSGQVAKSSAGAELKESSGSMYENVVLKM
ncbi:hypothetical protein HF521_007197 [Silurus meridionalis]|uniref:Ig-like domain-containing protein n=2 Tax=Silurus meridionalis TaxID=175797 RepID=A0A8T0AQT3_SILME|nr:hypothetical protein HF521_007197 [Silurus meridionalis]